MATKTRRVRILSVPSAAKAMWVETILLIAANDSPVCIYTRVVQIKKKVSEFNLPWFSYNLYDENEALSASDGDFIISKKA